MKRKRSGRKRKTTKKSRLDVSDPMLEVFSNDVIVRRLDKMLSLTDLKNLRLVNRQLNSFVISRTSFTSRICVTVNKDLISSRVLEKVTFPIKVLGIECFRADKSQNRICTKGCVQSGFPQRTHLWHFDIHDSSANLWKRIPPAKVWTPDEVEHIYQSLEHVEELSVFCPDTELSDSCFCDTQSFGPSFQLFPSVNRIIQNSKKTLNKLRLASKWLQHVLEDYDGSLRTCLKQVTQLELHASGSRSKVPESLLVLRKLQCFNLHLCYSLAAKDDAIIDQLIRSNVKGLQSLVLHNKWLSIYSKTWIRVTSSMFPNLRQLDLHFRENDATSISTFLQNNQKSLQSLTLRFYGFHASFPEQVLGMLPILSTMRELSLHLEDYVNTLPMERLAVLKNCKALQSFRFEMKTYSDDINGMKLPQVFNYIPVTMLQLSLHGYKAYNGPPLSRLSVGKMVNLRSLHLAKCYAAVNNETLEEIFRKLTLLKELVLTHTTGCTIEGFVGNGSPESASIKNLADLEKLTLNHCNLTDAVIYKAFEFPKLKFLDISGGNLTPTLRLRYILTRNPLLEVLRLGKVAKSYSKNQLIELKKFHPSLRQLQVMGDFGKVAIVG